MEEGGIIKLAIKLFRNGFTWPLGWVDLRTLPMDDADGGREVDRVRKMTPPPVRMKTSRDKGLPMLLLWKCNLCLNM